MSATSNDATRAGNISQFTIFKALNNAKNFADFSTACVELSYYEDILSNTVTATATIVESGLTASPTVQTRSVLDSLPIRGGEPIELIIEDNQTKPTQLKFSRRKNNELYVNRVRRVSPGTQKQVYNIDLCTREFLTNEQVRVVKRYDGNISNNVKKILLQDLGNNKAAGSPYGLRTRKHIEVDPTAENYNFIGNDRKPFNVCTWLASKSVPVFSKDGKSGYGKVAGYFFYETYEGFKFKSIDKLLKVDPETNPIRGRYVFTNTADLPPDYDGKILAVDIERDIDLQQNLTMGAYSNTTLFFNPFNFLYTRDKLSIEQTSEATENAGSQPIGNGIPKEFVTGPSRLMNRVLDVGTLPSGSSALEQLKKWKSDPTSPTFKAAQILAQSAMRYNQLFYIKTRVTIAGDFSLRAGQVIYCDFPELTVDHNKEKNKETGGHYLIVSVCHRITTEDCYSSLTLVRDTMGRMPYTYDSGQRSGESSREEGPYELTEEVVEVLAEENSTYVHLDDTSIKGDYDYTPGSNVPYQGGIPLDGV